MLNDFFSRTTDKLPAVIKSNSSSLDCFFLVDLLEIRRKKTQPAMNKTNFLTEEDTMKKAPSLAKRASETQKGTNFTNFLIEQEKNYFT